MLLVDGGVGDNLPVDAAMENWEGRILAVDISSGSSEVPVSPTFVQVGALTYSALSERVNELYYCEPDFYFRPDLHGAKSYEFTNRAADSLIDAGYRQAIEFLESHPEIPRGTGDSDGESRVPPCIRKVGEVRLEGLDEIRPETVRDWLMLKEGQEISPRLLREAAGRYSVTSHPL